MATKQPGSKGQAWFCTTGLPSDVAIEVDGMTFHLHKFPLMGKSRKLHEMITEQETNQRTNRFATIQTVSEQNQSNENDEGEEEIQEEDNEGQFHFVLPDFPGGCEAFEPAAKFCYGVKVDLSANNVAALRCAGEYLEMTEEYSEDNLISKTERFLAQSTLKNIKHSIKTLTSCERLLPMAENLGIVQRCIEAIATKAAAADPSLFGWPMNGGAVDSKPEADARRKYGDVTRGAAIADSWLDDLGYLSVHIFKRLIFAMKALNLSGDIVESCLMNYAKKFIPGISRTTTRKPSASSNLPSENERRELLETIISNLPIEKTSRSTSNTTRFLFGLLRTSYILNASEVSRRSLEKKIGSQLEQATLDDLLIPSYSYLNETLYDVDCVERILVCFLQRFEERSVTRTQADEEEGNSPVSTALITVGKLIDGYLSEIASDANLKPEKFYEFAITLPDRARVFDDGLYRAVDVYLKAHPWISETDRERICGVLDCQKLTLEACTHAAQNERLPLRAVVQVLFFEQLQLRHAISGTILGGRGTENEDEEMVERSRAEEGNGTWRTAVRDNQMLRGDMDSMRARVQDLERECSMMKTTIEKMDNSGPRGHGENGSWWSKLGCKFKSQVCDSHEPTGAEGGKRRREL
ncbi:BTB/POZ domain-containing protein At5g66560-like [Primulina huaijiensis]|uniref:BTB/POZ domain-containing protein At5g66560-like n=1 Tax=Primulina huaijiensis TaxID=1492673 RepID=UPI003CC72EF9